MTNHGFVPRASLSQRRWAQTVDLPIDLPTKARLGRAIQQALINPNRSPQSLRRTVAVVVVQLRVQGFTEEGIHARLMHLIQAVALNRGLDATSFVSGKPRWQELAERVTEWLIADALEP